MLKHIIVISSILLSLNSAGQKFFDSIPSAQLEALEISFYKNALFNTNYIELQPTFRKQHFPQEIQKLLAGTKPLTDSLWIVEEFNDGCFDCQSFRTKILYQGKVWFLTTRDNTVQMHVLDLSEYSDSLKLAFPLHEISEVKHRIEKNIPWNEDTLKYGLDGCHDGSHTFLTIVPPNGKTRSVYVRCWAVWHGKHID